jgi:hypothetical protein
MMIKIRRAPTMTRAVAQRRTRQEEGLAIIGSQQQQQMLYCRCRRFASTSIGSGGSSRRQLPATMVALAVTGTLQDGFSMRSNLDYMDPTTGQVTVAQFIGWGLCRGLQAFLDVSVQQRRPDMMNASKQSVVHDIIIPCADQGAGLPGVGARG